MTLAKNEYNLTVRCRKNKKERQYLYRLPESVSLNSRCFHWFALGCHKQYDLIEKGLEDFFKKGKQINFKIFTPEVRERLDIMIFGYFTYKRFISFLGKHFPEFLKKSRHYKGKSVDDMLRVFAPASPHANMAGNTRK